MVRKDSFSRKVFYICNVIFLLLMAATVLFPYLNVLAKAFNDGNDTARGGIVIWPRVFTLENFATVLKDKAFYRAFLISACNVLIGTCIALVVQFFAAYVFLNKHFIGHKFLMTLFLIPMYFGGGLIPMYILYAKTGLLNNYILYVLPGCFVFYNMVIIRSYLSSIPPSLAESAKVDGANDLIIAIRIMLPLAKPVIATVALWTAVGKWNDWTTTLYFITKKEMFTLQYVLMQVLKEAQKIQDMLREAAMYGEAITIKPKVTTESVQSAQLIITTLPIVLTYPFLQKYFIQGMTLGAVKD